MKYIILDLRNPTALVFTDTFKHCDAARCVNCPIGRNDSGSEYGENYGNHPRVIGAGFVRIRKTGLVVCEGRSTSLYRDPSGTPTESRGIEDAKLIARELGQDFYAEEK